LSKTVFHSMSSQHNLGKACETIVVAGRAVDAVADRVSRAQRARLQPRNRPGDNVAP
jgi:hypothetical protein